MNTLEVGLKVHYVQPSDSHTEATITKVHNDEVVDLHVGDGAAGYDRKTVVYREEPVDYSWHFIETECSL